MTSTASIVDRRVTRLRDRNPQAWRLAQRVSFAVMVDPALLRQVRVELVPDADAGAEADLWFSSLVESRAPNGIVFSSDVADTLRRGLAPTDGAAAWKITERLHRHLPPALRIEEELNWLSLDPSANRERITDLLQSAVGALVGAGESYVANWAGRALPRIPESLRGLDPTLMLSVASDLHLGRHLTLSEQQREQAMPSWLYAMVPKVPRTQLCVRMGPSGVEIGPPTVEGALIEVPLTRPMLIEVTSGKGTQRRSQLVAVQPEETAAPVFVAPGEVRLRTLAREEYVLRPSPRATPVVTPAQLTVQAIADTNINYITWRASQEIDGCIGFFLERRTPEGTIIRHTRAEERHDVSADRAPLSPLQQFSWLDENPAPSGNAYRVIPVFGTATQQTASEDHASAWSSEVRSEILLGPVAAHFNRPALLQPPLVQLPLAQRATSKSAPPTYNPSRVRNTALLTGLLNLLREAKSQDAHVYMVVSEINDAEVIDAVAALGRHAHLVATERAERDAPSLKEQTDYTVFAETTARELHQQFAVVCGPDSAPRAVWTAGGPWTTADFTTRLRGAVLLRDPDCAGEYLRQWFAVRNWPGSAASGDPFTRPLPSGETIETWFSPRAGGKELDRVRRLMRNATTGVLFCLDDAEHNGFDEELTFLNKIGVYTSGVTAEGPRIRVYDGRRAFAVDARLVEISGGARDVDDPVHGPVAPLRQRFIVIDPFGSHPIVITGSHRLTRAAARSHEDLVIIHGSRQLAAQYAARAAHILSRVRTGDADADTGSRDVSPTWQTWFFLDHDVREKIAFWSAAKLPVMATRRPIRVGKPIKLKNASATKAPAAKKKPPTKTRSPVKKTNARKGSRKSSASRRKSARKSPRRK